MFDDLLNTPYKSHGRGKYGYDCYGLVLECVKRTGKTLKDAWYDVERVESAQCGAYVAQGLNVRKIETAQKHAIVEMEYNGNLHIGFMIDKKNVMHTTHRGVRITPLFYCKVIDFYEVL